MKRERDLGIRAFEDEIKIRDHAMTRVKDKRSRCAMASERAAVTKALADFSASKEKELAIFQREQGRDAAGRVKDLPHDWYKDEERSPRVRVDRDEDPCRLSAPFDDGWN